jgi:hypothetical protein
MVPICAAQADDRHLRGTDLVAWRPDGNWIRAVRTVVRGALGTRFWKNASPPPLSRVDSTMPGCTPFGHRSSVVGRRASARMIPSSTAR